ncbi:MAG: YicC/YloC family endoribonuclease [Pseudomonadota bacterium]
MPPIQAATLVALLYDRTPTASMIHSMTAFARESANTEGGTITVELRSVNHRYLDCSFKLPDVLRALEPKLRERAGKALARGKLECLIRVQSLASGSGELQIDEARLDALLSSATDVAARLEQSAPLNPLQLLQFPGVSAAPQANEEALQNSALALFDNALQNLQETRQREGSQLTGMIEDRLQQVEQEVVNTRDVMPQLLQHQRERVTGKITELGVEVDEGRLEQELVYLLQKADVDEELDRLETHIAEVRRALKKGGPCGRRLDFLMQELNREANTLSSKSLSAQTTHNAVELKVLIEQMREQIQNIE